MAQRKIKPPAALTPRNGNERLVTLEAGGFSYDWLVELSCFEASVLEKLREFPGAIIMRFYRKDEVICYQDDPGYTAFYILKKNEIERLVSADRLQPIAGLENRPPQGVASVRRRSYGKKGKESNPVYMAEGEVFGEMSCLSRTPRSSTVRAEHDCYVLEFMSNVFVQGRFERKLGTKVIERILELHLRGVELFERLTDEQYLAIVGMLKQRLGLGDKTEKPGADKAPADKKAKKYELLTPRKHDEVLFAEHDRPDGLYIIRLGMVKVVKNASPLLGKDDVVDWPRFEAALRAGAEPTSPLHFLWKNLPGHLWQKLDDSRNKAAAPWGEEQQELLYALNDVLKLKNFHESIQFKFDPKNPLHALLEKETKSLKDGKYLDEIVALRGFNRRLLQALVGDALRPFGATPPHTLAIRSSREWVFAADDSSTTMAESSLLGEIGLFENVPRGATCVAYCHPEAKFGETELFFIPKDLLTDLLDPKYVQEVIAERGKATRSRLGLSVWQENANTQRFQELGLMQGQKLLLIDLDRCTRCDKCVEACVASHSPPGLVGSLVEKCLPFEWNPFRNTGPRDGRSRLFLDGPRIQVHEEAGIRNYLVPATCRQCKDPVCLVGCPVGSIHKGQNGQIVIEDWCIGCTKCATNCPYNSIQMHTIGVLPRSSVGWLIAQGPVAHAGAAPFRHNREFAETHGGTEPIRFTRTFELTAAHLESSKTFMLHVESSAATLTATINGEAIALRRLDDKEAKQKDWHWEALLALVGETAPPMVPGEQQQAPQPKLRRGQNQVTIELELADSKAGGVLLDVGLTGYVLPVVDPSVAGDDYVAEWVTQNAVVCDMCSGQPGHRPACVTACPHDAAERRYITYDSFLPADK